jgi:hypothetical protein
MKEVKEVEGVKEKRKHNAESAEIRIGRGRGHDVFVPCLIRWI